MRATPHWTRRRPLWAQILALTVFVLLLPIVGFLLLNRFGKNLIEAEAAAVRAGRGHCPGAGDFSDSFR